MLSKQVASGALSSCRVSRVRVNYYLQSNMILSYYFNKIILTPLKGTDHR